eukprot:NODE_219_length_14015_cov_0.496335.p8 type:complete len:119 gc:universal NODE_219_length_14015_cov_0.496335:10781-11137(+)
MNFNIILLICIAKAHTECGDQHKAAEVAREAARSKECWRASYPDNKDCKDLIGEVTAATGKYENCLKKENCPEEIKTYHDTLPYTYGGCKASHDSDVCKEMQREASGALHACKVAATE